MRETGTYHGTHKYVGCWRSIAIAAITCMVLANMIFVLGRFIVPDLVDYPRSSGAGWFAFRVWVLSISISVLEAYRRWTRRKKR